MAYYAAATASLQVKVGPGKFRGAFVEAASGSPQITLHDSGTASSGDPKMYPILVPTVGMWIAAPDPDGVTFTKGLYLIIGGTVSVTMFYE